MKDLELCRRTVRENEQSGKEPRCAVYDDHKKPPNPTISSGFNLNRPDASEICQKYGVDYHAVRNKTAVLTKEQALDIEQHVIDEAEKICISKLGESHFEKLNAHQQAALISLAFTPSLLGSNLIKFIQESRFQDAFNEIKHRSNAGNHHGIQNRRDREAALFATTGDFPHPRSATDTFFSAAGASAQGFFAQSANDTKSSYRDSLNALSDRYGSMFASYTLNNMYASVNSNSFSWSYSRENTNTFMRNSQSYSSSFFNSDDSYSIGIGDDEPNDNDSEQSGKRRPWD